MTWYNTKPVWNFCRANAPYFINNCNLEEFTHASKETAGPAAVPVHGAVHGHPRPGCRQRDQPARRGPELGGRLHSPLAGGRPGGGRRPGPVPARRQPDPGRAGHHFCAAAGPEREGAQPLRRPEGGRVVRRRHSEVHRRRHHGGRRHQLQRHPDHHPAGDHGDVCTGHGHP